MTTHEVLVEARNLIDREGWAQGALRSRQGEFCARGAINWVASGGEWSSGLSCPAQTVLRDTLGAPDYYAVVLWNNDPERTKEEVLAAFDKAIAKTAPEPNTDFLNRASWREPEAVA